MTRAFDDYRDTPLWSAVEKMIQELSASSEIRVDTAPDYVVGFLCRELAAKRLLATGALKRPS